MEKQHHHSPVVSSVVTSILGTLVPPLGPWHRVLVAACSPDLLSPHDILDVELLVVVHDPLCHFLSALRLDTGSFGAHEIVCFPTAMIARRFLSGAGGGTVAFTDATDFSDVARELGDDCFNALDGDLLTSRFLGRDRRLLVRALIAWWSPSARLGHAALEGRWPRTLASDQAVRLLVTLVRPFAGASAPALWFRATFDVIRSARALVAHVDAAVLGAVAGRNADTGHIVFACAGTVDG